MVCCCRRARSAGRTNSSENDQAQAIHQPSAGIGRGNAVTKKGGICEPWRAHRRVDNNENAQAVRAPGSKVTVPPLIRAGPVPLNRETTRTAPVKFSAPPAVDGCELARVTVIA
jgi:hypothetical protein